MQIDQKEYISYDFSNAEIDSEELSRVKFDNCNFRRTDFSDIDVMYNCVFESCDFTNARLNGVTIKDCAFLSCTFRNASFFAVVLEDCKMTGSDFAETELGTARIIGGDFSYTSLRKQAFQKQ
ncbi:MAG: pentapeptide repeat-containing protein, partial [Oscillospiraceae bacterium]|nr:pentapeptide repeat-containing protein [Oscillospiraceae bacterium]